MTRSIEEVAEIAGKLTKAGHGALVGGSGAFVRYTGPATADHARRLGLVAEARPVPISGVRLTPLGLAVRTHLQQEGTRNGG